MSMNRFNSEGYIDMTAFKALTNIEKEAKKTSYKPLVYICSPYSGDVDDNTAKTREYCRFAVRQNCIPLASHLHYPQFLDDSVPSERELGVFFGMVLMSKCSEVWVFGSRISSGMALEIEKAKSKNQPIKYFSDTCEEVRPK